MTTEPGRALPLTDAEAAVVRQIVTNGLPGDHEIGNVTVARLLATLDAARAATLAEVRRRVEALPRQMQHADPFFPETYDYETVGLDATRAILAAMEAER